MRCSPPVVTLIFQILTALAFTQTQATFRDTAAAGSPLALSGTLTSDGHTTQYTIIGKNVGSKEIVAFYVESKPIGTFTAFVEHDYFFKSNGIAPDETLEISTVTEDWAARPGITPETKLVYAQFADGTSWGDQKVGARISAKRPTAQAHFERLLTIYEQQGEAAFLMALRTDTSHSGISYQLLSIQAKLRTAAALDHLKMRINSGKAREAAGVK